MAGAVWPSLSLRGGVVQEYSLDGPDPHRAFPGPWTPPGPVDGRGFGFVVNTLPRREAGIGTLLRHRQILAIATIGMGEHAFLRGIRQSIFLGGHSESADMTDWVEQRVTGQTWTFTDTYTTWHVSWAPGVNSKRILALGSAGIDGYQPFNGWGTFYDLRFPPSWEGPAPVLDAPMVGPGSIFMWLEFTQSDPATRTHRGPGPPGAFINPDDQFAEMAYPTTSVYYRIAGGLLLERGIATDPGGQ